MDGAHARKLVDGETETVAGAVEEPLHATVPLAGLEGRVRKGLLDDLVDLVAVDAVP